MVTIGYSKPYVALYNGSTGQDVYTEGMDLGGGVSYSDSIEVADDNDFYADNRVDETESGVFTSGEATMTVNYLSAAAAKMVLGLTNQQEVSTTQWDAYDDDANPPDIGYGHVKKVMDGGVVQYIGFVLPRIKMALPSESAETQGESIDWQTQELTATIMRSLNGKHPWRYVAETPFDTEDEAYAAVKAFLSQNGAAAASQNAQTGGET